MTYLALGDSISIDDYTGLPDGGAASQFAKLILAERFQNLSGNGFTTLEVLQSMRKIHVAPDIVTLTVGGNNFISGLGPFTSGKSALWEPILYNILDGIGLILDQLERFHCPIIVNTVYDPTDGDDQLAATLGITASARLAFDALNSGIRDLARTRSLILGDLEILFRGHGFWAGDPWIVQHIEPSLPGATAIAAYWHGLLQQVQETTRPASPSSHQV